MCINLCSLQMPLSSLTSLMESNSKVNGGKGDFVSLFFSISDFKKQQKKTIPCFDLKNMSDQMSFFQFDLLAFPDEIIEQFFSYLDLEERLRMRLNGRLHRIEAESKCYIEEMVLMQVVIFLLFLFHILYISIYNILR